jgi:hypothetical protein
MGEVHGLSNRIKTIVDPNSALKVFLNKFEVSMDASKKPEELWKDIVSMIGQGTEHIKDLKILEEQVITALRQVTIPCFFF